MAYDQFTNAGVTTYTFERGNTFPITHDYKPNMIQSVSGGGTSKVLSIGTAQEFWSINLVNITTSSVDDLYAFFSNPLVNFGEKLFTWIDYNSTSRRVRLWSTNFTIEQTSADLNSIKLILKVES